jgi:hypothetical protein
MYSYRDSTGAIDRQLWRAYKVADARLYRGTVAALEKSA